MFFRVARRVRLVDDRASTVATGGRWARRCPRIRTGRFPSMDPPIVVELSAPCVAREGGDARRARDVRRWDFD